MSVSIVDLFIRPALEEIKASIITIAEGAGLPVTSWVEGDPSERWIEISARVTDAFLSAITTQAVRGFFLDLATDPGDEGDLSADQTPRPGWLSALGEGWYGTQRRGETFATGFVTLTNDGATNAVFGPLDLTFQSTIQRSDGGYPTYRNTADDSIYGSLSGTVTLPPGESIELPILADQIGSYGNAAGGQISVVVTASFGTLSVTNNSALSGSDREGADAYRVRCRQAAASLSPGGPGEAYQYAATTAKDGSPLARHDGSGLVAITRTQVDDESDDGTVHAYFATATGAAIAVDQESADANITGIPLGDITDPIGIVPDGVTYASDPATEVSVSVIGATRIRRVVGMTDAELRAAVKDAINTALVDAFADFPIGGVDFDAGSGNVYKADILAIARDAYPGQYNPTLSSPSADVALSTGEVAVLDFDPSTDWTVTVV